MRVLCAMGSPRKGNSERLCQEFIELSRANGHGIEYINVGKKIYSPCHSCKIPKCRKVGRCKHNDYLSKLFEKVNFDALVIFTPVYFFSFTAQMKIFIDRFGAVDFNKRKDLQLAIITTSGSDKRMGGYELLNEAIKRTCEWSNMNFAGNYNKVTGDNIVPITFKDINAIKEIIRRIEKYHDNK